MQTMMIDSKNPRFDALKKTLDDKVEKFRLERKMHTVGRNIYYHAGKIEYVEYVYGFSDEQGIPSNIANAEGDTDPNFAVGDTPITAEIISFIDEVKEDTDDEKTLYEGLNNKAITEGWTIEQIARALAQPVAAISSKFDSYGIDFGVVITPTPAPTTKPGGGTSTGGGGSTGGGDPVTGTGGISNEILIKNKEALREFIYQVRGSFEDKKPMAIGFDELCPGTVIEWRQIPATNTDFQGSGWGSLQGIAGGTFSPSTGSITIGPSYAGRVELTPSSIGIYKIELTVTQPGIIPFIYNNIVLECEGAVYERKVLINGSDTPPSISATSSFTISADKWQPGESITINVLRDVVGVGWTSVSGMQTTENVDAYGFIQSPPLQILTPGSYKVWIGSNVVQNFSKELTFTIT